MSEGPALSHTAAPGAVAPNEGDQVVIFNTNLGRIVLKLFPDVAPKHVESFTSLVGKGFYDGILFHRVIPGFVIQGGDPNTKDQPRHSHGTGGPGYSVPAEFNDIPHTRGILSMARSSDPNSGGSQFFICVDRVASLDRQYTVFGQVVEGMDVVDAIVNLPRDSRDNPHEANPARIESGVLGTWPV